jgi:hypothetical protein
LFVLVTVNQANLPQDNMERSPYHYEPSLAAAIIFAVTFGISTTAHTYQLIRGRTWYFIPFLVGGIGKHRIALQEYPKSVWPRNG